MLMTTPVSQIIGSEAYMWKRNKSIVMLSFYVNDADKEVKSDIEEQKKKSSDDDEDESFAMLAGRCCAWCIINHIDIPMFIISFIVLYLSVDRCCYCVFVVAFISAFLCMRFPILNATLWSALAVLYLHKDWNLNFGDVKITWNRAT